MTYCFRMRFDLAATSGMQCPDPTLAFTSDDAVAHQVELACADGSDAITSARKLVLRGAGYASEPEALAAGYRWRSRLMWVFVCLRIGADFGDRTGHNTVTKAGLRLLAPDRRALNDTHGLVVFECEPAPIFITAGSVSLQLSIRQEQLTAAMETAQQADGLGEREQVAYDLLSTSQSETTSVDARFALLMMAVESLIEPAERSAEARAIVDNLIGTVNASDLPPREIQSIGGSLGWLRKESISQAGRRLAATLEPRTYMDLRPATFFTRCYEIRGRLLHGIHPIPTRGEVGACAAGLEVFVADLLCGTANIPSE